MLLSRHCRLLPPLQASRQHGAPLAVLPQLSATIALARLAIEHQPPRSASCRCRFVLLWAGHCFAFPPLSRTSQVVTLAICT